MDAQSEKVILKALPNLTSLLIHCKKASGDLLAQAGLDHPIHHYVCTR
jgi:hypothetical protein